MSLNEFFNNSSDNEEEIKTSHLINISAAISRFPGLMNRIVSSFYNDDDEILEKYNEIKIEDDELRKKLICAIIYGEIYERDLLMKIIENYVNDFTFNSIVFQNVKKNGDREGYALACALLDNYYNYLDTNVWN